VTTTGSGKADYIPLWSTGASTKLGIRCCSRSGTGATAKVGINTSHPSIHAGCQREPSRWAARLTLPATGTATATAGDNSEPLDLAASVFNTGVSEAVAQTFQLQAEPVGNDTATTSGALSLLYGSGTSAPAETGLQIASNGQITFATGQAFPGTGCGTVTSVASGTGLTGGRSRAAGH
jgi:hypothetical protein